MQVEDEEEIAVQWLGLAAGALPGTVTQKHEPLAGERSPGLHSSSLVHRPSSCWFCWPRKASRSPRRTQLVEYVPSVPAYCGNSTWPCARIQCLARTSGLVGGQSAHRVRSSAARSPAYWHTTGWTTCQCHGDNHVKNHASHKRAAEAVSDVRQDETTNGSSS